MAIARLGGHLADEFKRRSFDSRADEDNGRSFDSLAPQRLVAGDDGIGWGTTSVEVLYGGGC